MAYMEFTVPSKTLICGFKLFCCKEFKKKKNKFQNSSLFCHDMHELDAELEIK